MSSISGRDVLVLLKVTAHQNEALSMRRLAAGLEMSPSSVADSVKRLRSVGLMKQSRGAEINRIGVREFLVHGLRWIAPGSVSGVELGLRTAAAASPLREQLIGSEEMVMPLKGGPDRGVAVSPIDEAAPRAAQQDPQLHKLLALADAIRVGNARSKELAASEIRACV
jgi:hypothetical protein